MLLPRLYGQIHEFIRSQTHLKGIDIYALEIHRIYVAVNVPVVIQKNKLLIWVFFF